MKNTMKKILALALVALMTVPFMAIAAFAEDGEVSLPENYGAVEDGELIANVDFNNTDYFGFKGTWAGANVEVSEDGKSFAYIPQVDTNGNGRTSAWGGCLPGAGFTIHNSAYTTVFTLSAEDENQSIAYYPDWRTGFFFTPGKNTISYIVNKSEKLDSTEFTVEYEGPEGDAALTQTYAIEIKDEGTGEHPEGAMNTDNTAEFQYNVTVYNVYVVKDGAWELIFSMEDEPVYAQQIKDNLAWGYDSWEYVIRFGRDNVTPEQFLTMEVHNVSIYKGLAVTEHELAAPELDIPSAGEEGGEENGNENNGENNENNNENNNTNTTPETNPNTDANTEAAPAPETEAAAGGCGSSIGIAGVAMIALASGAALVIKRKED